MRIAIIGGGYTGYALAHHLDAHVDVTLIEARGAFVHNVAAIRAVTDPALTHIIILPYDRLLKRGRVLRGRAVDSWLRPSNLPNVFAIGDLIDTGEGMTVVATTRQAPWLAKTIRKLASGKALETLPTYKPWPQPPILLPLGPANGASVLPLSRQGTVAGDWITSKIKGKSLFIPRYHQEFGQ